MNNRAFVTVASMVAATLTLTAAAAAQVKTSAGLVKGTTADEGRIRIFKGIPFAAAPAGELRWKEPRPAAPWDGVREATEFGRQCMQGPVFSDITFPHPPSEDCLNLNIWTPAKEPDDR
ncbi:MAG TPA: carboxylesterase family protein, partial [Vicinamibacterales bacterium]|nr:carboxylesterase family protein [Vicinamibacterales bacterium]